MKFIKKFEGFKVAEDNSDTEKAKKVWNEFTRKQKDLVDLNNPEDVKLLASLADEPNNKFFFNKIARYTTRQELENGIRDFIQSGSDDRMDVSEDKVERFSTLEEFKKVRNNPWLHGGLNTSFEDYHRRNGDFYLLTYGGKRYLGQKDSSNPEGYLFYGEGDQTVSLSEIGNVDEITRMLDEA